MNIFGLQKNIMLMVLIVVSVFQFCKTRSPNIGKNTGHLKPFGCCGEQLHIKEILGYPSTKQFFDEFVLKSKPLKMTGASKNTTAYKLWEDDYFLNLDIPEDDLVLIEKEKKENRTISATYMHFKDFVKIYNTTDQYMVQTIPQYLGKDFTLPHPLQCQEVFDKELLQAQIMWFSSGGTKSVVHTDNFENINCVLRGVKEFILVSPEQKHLVDLDHPEGAYSDIDVDSVDYNYYPGLAFVDYYQVILNPGDCLYLPYKWIHHVRSYNRNLAVNVWWKHIKNGVLDLQSCDQHVPDPNMTLDRILPPKYNDESLDRDEIREFCLDLSRYHKLTLEALSEFIIEHFYDKDEIELEHILPMLKIFSHLDKNGNHIVEHEEVTAASEKDWKFVFDEMEKYKEELLYVDELLYGVEVDHTRQHALEEL